MDRKTQKRAVIRITELPPTAQDTADTPPCLHVRIVTRGSDSCEFMGQPLAAAGFIMGYLGYSKHL